MPFNFPYLDKKLKEGSLTLKDIINKALAINVALRGHLVDKPNFRNHVFQGYIGWVIMERYLLTRQGLLNAEITSFLIFLKKNLDEALKALDENKPIRDYIMKLNEYEIMTRPNQTEGKIYHPYSEEQKTGVLNFLRENELINEVNGKFFFNAIFYLFYRNRDGRFFWIADKKMDFGSALKLGSCFADDLKSTHICMNEGIKCDNIYKDNFLKYHEEHKNDPLPCFVDSNDEFFYCGEARKDIELSGKMTAIELCKNPPAEEIHCLYLCGSIVTYKEKLGFPEQVPPVQLHITIGRKLREPDMQIANLSTESLLDLLEKCESPYTKPLLDKRQIFATEHNSLVQEKIEISRYGLFPLVSPQEMIQWNNVRVQDQESLYGYGSNKPW